MALNKLMQITFIPHENNRLSASGVQQNASLGKLAPNGWFHQQSAFSELRGTMGALFERGPFAQSCLCRTFPYQESGLALLLTLSCLCLCLLLSLTFHG